MLLLRGLGGGWVGGEAELMPIWHGQILCNAATNWGALYMASRLETHGFELRCA